MKGAFTLRRAAADDYPAFARLFPELEVDDLVPDHARWESDIALATWVAEQDGAVIAYCHCQEMEASGYVRNLVVAPEARGQGVGRALMEHAAAHLRARGARRWMLNVKPDNAPAVRLYASLGFLPVHRSSALRLLWTSLDRLPEDARLTHARVVGAERDATLERTFGLPGGLLSGRRRLGRVLLELVESDSAEPVGFALLDPAFPGAFPFRVKRPTLAAPLLRALRPHALPEHEHLQVVVENDAPLADLMLVAGAILRHEVVQLEGEL